MPLTLQQLEDVVFRLKDQVEELSERLEDLEDPFKRRQMTGRPPRRARTSLELQEELFTRETRKWSAIGLDPDIQDFVNVSGTAPHLPRLQAITDVASILFPFRDIIKKVFSIFGPEGSLVRIKFRGSLVRGLKAYHKGPNKFASQAFDPNQFDCDAFIEVPDVLWEKFLKAGFKKQVYDATGTPIPGKQTRISLERRYESLQSIVLAPAPPLPQPTAMKWWDVLQTLTAIQNFIRTQLLAFVPGYRTIGGVYDFEFYLRPISNVWWIYKEGNPYYQHQDLSGFSFAAAAEFDEFLFKDLPDIQRYAEQFGLEGRLAPDLQCVIDEDTRWFIETQEVFDWLMETRRNERINPQHERERRGVLDHSIARLSADGKIVDGPYNWNTVDQIRQNPVYDNLLMSTVNLVSTTYQGRP